RKEMRRFIEHHGITRAHIITLLSMPVISYIYQLFNRPIGEVRNLTLPLDGQIPFLPQFIIIYHLWYLFLIFNIGYLLLRDKDEFMKAILSINLGNILAYITFFFFQSRVPRPLVTGEGFFESIVRFTYTIDQPYNGFPSIHVLTTTVMMIALARMDIRKDFKYGSLFFGLLIILSTVFVKQHVVLDILGGLTYAGASYVIISGILGRFLFKTGSKEGLK
ncbi:MAG TPA: phosphatase PAP2 family protein, partial [Clostridiaceae bacterium]|nr:phosphatase PAP2 family protein [Clostridiaceae bacterium]